LAEDLDEKKDFSARKALVAKYRFTPILGGITLNLSKNKLTDQPLILRTANGLCTCVHLQFAVNVFNVCCNCLAADIDFKSYRTASAAV
jgi:hypothetical protein